MTSPIVGSFDFCELKVDTPDVEPPSPSSRAPAMFAPKSKNGLFKISKLNEIINMKYLRYLCQCRPGPAIDITKQCVFAIGNGIIYSISRSPSIVCEYHTKSQTLNIRVARQELEYG